VAFRPPIARGLAFSGMAIVPEWTIGFQKKYFRLFYAYFLFFYQKPDNRLNI
jgi:hypothetical protein